MEDRQNMVCYLLPTWTMTALGSENYSVQDNLTIAFLVTDQTEPLSGVFPVIRLLHRIDQIEKLSIEELDILITMIRSLRNGSKVDA